MLLDLSLFLCEGPCLLYHARFQRTGFVSLRLYPWISPLKCTARGRLETSMLKLILLLRCSKPDAAKFAASLGYVDACRNS